MSGARIVETSQVGSTGLDAMGWEGASPWGPPPKPTAPSDREGEAVIKRSSTEFLTGTQNHQGPQNQRKSENCHCQEESKEM